MRYPVLSGEERFRDGEGELPFSVRDFWAWSRSRLLADGPRGDLAEFLVTTALGLDITQAKRGWGECDVLYDGLRIEVKCSSLLQPWERTTPTKPVFSIAKTRNCDIEETEEALRYVGRDETPPSRRSEIYVFCLFANPDRDTADPLKTGQWEFYVVPTPLIDQRFGNRRSLTLSALRQFASPRRYDQLREAVEDARVFGPFDSVTELMNDLNEE